ncbi:MAG: phospho-N-acetylmuramoyl-pentapeptide-transferase [Firmicutes bacterium]|nr:phospho-N-acetylmuramoyl-pentapeptide-transferase [Bacillota bacterium]
MREIIFYFLGAFGVAIAFAPFAVWLLKRLKAGQEILKYVDFHKQKSGTPTMGGIIFILPLVVLTPIFVRVSHPFSLVVILASVGFALLGFLDDFIKIRTKKNQGLRAYQKIIGQGGIAILVALFYTLLNPEGRILIPFFNVFWDMGLFIGPLVFVVMIATTNAVNLTDGIDGLASTVSLVFLVFLAVIMQIAPTSFPEHREFMLMVAIAVGGLLAFLLFNSNKASVFMGDTGSLYLGALLATLSVFSFLGFFILFLGIMFVWSALSVIMQVAYFKVTKGKRVFKMTPFHHHLEKSGWAEARIVALYAAITIIAGVLLVITLV